MRIRGSRPSLTGAPDYPDLRVVDPTHYALGREIARGGMGRIWVARDRRLGRDIALKEVLGDAPGVRRRFEREARITARLQHPSIVGVHEAGLWPSGEPFYAMRLVSGRSLDEAIAAASGFEGRLALLPNVLAVADAMAYAHGQNVIHRDLKPRNVVVGEFGETVVIDWGLAKDLGDATASSLDGAAPERHATSASAPGETTAGDVLGTPAYMPPEQAAGESVDGRADVYAIGAMLYHVLAGEPPYRGPSNAEVIAAVMTGPPPPIRGRVPAVPGELVAILERAMARDRAARYPSARELADDLRRFQTGQLVGAHRYSLGQLVRRWLRRHRTALAAVAAGVLAAAVIGVIALRRVLAADRRAETERAEAVANRKSAEDLAQFMMGDLRDKVVGLGRLDLLDTVARRAVAYYAARGESASDEDREALAKAHDLLARALAARDDVDGAGHEFEQTAQLFAALAARRPDVIRYAAEATQARLDLNTLRREHDRSPALVEQLRGAVADADRLVANAPGDHAALKVATVAHGDLADVLDELGDSAPALGESERELALASQLAAAEPGDPVVARLLLDAHREHGDLVGVVKHDDAAALAEYRAALALGERQAAARPDESIWIDYVAKAHLSIADILLARSDLAGAKAELEAALPLSERLEQLEPANVDRSGALVSLHERLGTVAHNQHDFTEALAQFRTGEDILTKLLARDPNDLMRRRDLALLLAESGQTEAHLHHPDEALAEFERALAIRRELVAKEPANGTYRRDLTRAFFLIGVARSQIPGHMRDALASFRDELAAATENAAQHPSNGALELDVLQAHGTVGEALARLHELRAARVEFHAGLALAEKQAAAPGSDPAWKQQIATMREDLAETGERQPR